MDGLPTGTVTFLFTDLGSSTRLWEVHGDAMGSALARHDDLLARAVTSHGGHVVKTTGDGVHAAFATAEAAVAAALDAQRAVSAEQWGPTGALRVRMGLHTGGAELRDGDYYGPTLNRAARLMSIAHPGQVLCSQTTADLVRDSLPPKATLLDLGVHHLRDIARPELVFQLTHPEVDAAFPPLAGVQEALGNLPRQVTSFVGRQDDLARIVAELDTQPVVTLTGVGGVGKTRLALEAAELLRPALPDGAWLAELAGVREADQLPDAVLDVFGIERRGLTATQLLVKFLRGKQSLLVLDNCEHVLRSSARLVTELVLECPDLRVIATSREGLNVPGERILAVASLEVPTPEELDEIDPEALAQLDAVRLFVDRAKAVRAGFTVDTANASAIAQVCSRLDGVPLAIELAASRIGMLTPSELAARLDHRFRLLTGSERGAVERHQTLRAAIDWSYELLDEPERRLLARLSVFAGGFTLEAAEIVTSCAGLERVDVFDLLASLVARSLVVAESEAEATRYRLLETIRQYGQERLEASGDTDGVRDAHMRYYADLVESAIPHFQGSDQMLWFMRLSRDLDNIRVALARAIERQDADSALRIMNIETTGVIATTEIGSVIYDVAETVLAIPGVESSPLLPVALTCAGMRATHNGDWESASRYCDEAEEAERRMGLAPCISVWGVRMWIATNQARADLLFEATDHLIELSRANGLDTALAASLAQRALSRSLRGVELEEAFADLDEAIPLARRAGAPMMLVSVLGFAAFVLAEDQPARARALMAEAIAVHERDLVRLPLYSMIGDVAQRLGDRRLALEYFTRGLAEQRWLGYQEMVGRILRRVSLLLVDDAPADAAIVTGAAQLHSPVTMTDRVTELWEEGIAALDTALGEPARVELQRRGAEMSEREAIAFATGTAERVLARWGKSGVSTDSG